MHLGWSDYKLTALNTGVNASESHWRRIEIRSLILRSSFTHMTIFLVTLGVFWPNSSLNYLRGTVHWGVPGELNTSEGFSSVGICTVNRNPLHKLQKLSSWYSNVTFMRLKHNFCATYNNNNEWGLLHYRPTLESLKLILIFIFINANLFRNRCYCLNYAAFHLPQKLEVLSWELTPFQLRGAVASYCCC